VWLMVVTFPLNFSRSKLARDDCLLERAVEAKIIPEKRARQNEKTVLQHY
jgi:hypothetical protein